MEYVSETKLLGLPLVHIRTGDIVDGQYRRGIANGWIAIGDIAFGRLLGVGGVAIGGISMGGMGIGVLSFSGVSIGVAAFGQGVLYLLQASRWSRMLAKVCSLISSGNFTICRASLTVAAD